MIYEASSVAAVRLIDMVYPGDTNHHGTLFGGAALAHMDKIAFLAATRHGRRTFVTAASDRIDFAAPALLGDMVEVSGRVVRVGRKSLDVEVSLEAEAPITGERRLCTCGLFTLVATDGDEPLPPLRETTVPVEADTLRIVDMVFPPQTNHYGTLYGGDALQMMGRAAFIAATRHARSVMGMAASDRVDFTSPVREAEMVELVARVRMAGIDSVLVSVDLIAEDLLTGERREAATARFTMVAVKS